MSNIREFIENVFTDNLVEMRDNLHASLAQKISEALDEKKAEIAKKLLLDKDKCTEESCKDDMGAKK